MNTQKNNQNQLPLLLQNLKNAFKDNIQGPIKKREREYQATAKAVFLYDIAKFLAIRGVNKLVAIIAWDDGNEFKLAYHFIVKIGEGLLDSKISIITSILKNELLIKSLKKIYPNARLYEDEIAEHFNIQFAEK